MRKDSLRCPHQQRPGLRDLSGWSGGPGCLRSKQFRTGEELLIGLGDVEKSKEKAWGRGKL